MNNYKEIVIKYHKNPINKIEIDKKNKHCDFQINEKSSSCGDDIFLSLKLDSKKGGVVSHCGIYCAVTNASASILCSILEGKDKNFTRKLLLKIENICNERDSVNIYDELYFFWSEIKNHSARISCAMLPILALKKWIEV